MLAIMVSSAIVEGLTPAEAAHRLDRDGPNALPVMGRVNPWRLLVAQLLHFFAIMLWVAAGLAMIAGLPEIAIAIVAVVVANSVFAFVQEQRSEHAADRLRKLLPQRVTVRRHGPPVVVDASDLVVGDLVVVGPGDRVCADLQVVDDHGLRVDESTLTGESRTESVGVGGSLWAGTFVVEGVADAEVVATGADTRLAELAQLTSAVRRPPTPLAMELHRLVRTIAIVACSAGLGFLVLTVLFDTPITEGLVFAIGITVALVPEGLLPTTTLSLAVGARRMARQHALVRRLESVETLGSTTMICTDKTGTLTTNQMAVVGVWTRHGIVRFPPHGYDPVPVDLSGLDADHHRQLVAMAGHAAGCAGGSVVCDEGVWVPHGDPQEAALHVLARRLGAPDDHDGTADIRFAFSADRRCMSVVRNDMVVVKGAPDVVLQHCVGVPPDVHDALQDFTSAGLRVLAVAVRQLDAGDPVASAADVERELTLLGLVALQDPPRASVGEAIAACRAAGVAVVMVTGDHPLTAAAIAVEVGLAPVGCDVVVGDDLPDDDEMLGALVDRDGMVAARVSPPDKLRIAAALRRRGHVVAMTGDGVNDGPALREADIGVAMGASGTDVAREAADLVLLDDNFSTIVAAIAEGRATFANIRRFLTYHLTDNVAELTPFVIWALTGGQFPLALGVMQVLVLDLATDTLPAVALGAERPGAGVLAQRPSSGRLLDAATARRAFGVLGPTQAFMAMTAFTVSLLVAGWRPGDPGPGSDVLASASGAAFAAVITAQMANAFICRSVDRRVGRVAPANWLLYPAVAVAAVLGLVAIVVAPLADVLGQSMPSVPGAMVAAAAAPVMLLVDTVDKWRRRRAAGSTGSGTSGAGSPAGVSPATGSPAAVSPAATG